MIAGTRVEFAGYCVSNEDFPFIDYYGQYLKLFAEKKLAASLGIGDNVNNG